jgi:hypothetical protein
MNGGVAVARSAPRDTTKLGGLRAPIIGVAPAGWSLNRLIQRARIEHHGVGSRVDRENARSHDPLDVVLLVPTCGLDVPQIEIFLGAQLRIEQRRTAKRKPTARRREGVDLSQAFETLAPLESLIRARLGDLYRRTPPQYLQEVHFCEALKRLGELAGADSAAVSGVAP